ncbi:hypothetical protein SBA7_320003 [Candidatus Sulfotelmatobacter sp. SbA7]|nr:hypothetical protein SBA7_320003 [Candidatus Sulfotelmatobacter sp. SbA7]
MGWWALQDLNLGPMDYESTALTAELRAPAAPNLAQTSHRPSPPSKYPFHNYRSFTQRL